MGLSLHIHASTPASLGREAVRSLVARWQSVAQRFAAEGRLEEVLSVSSEAADLEQFATAWLSLPHPTDPDTMTGTAVPPLEGSIFLVQPGEGCEPLTLGLCRYPVSVKGPDGASLATGRDSGWRLLSSCKTQYAGLCGWDHFRRCHLAVVDLAEAGRSLGMEVHIEDEGGYWPNRDEKHLRAALEHLNRLAAGLAGVLKDSVDCDDTRAPSLQAPILSHPDFERLEAEALNGPDAQKFADALRAIRKPAP